MRRFVDLHTHSTASDGTLNAGEIVARAERLGLAAVALTDHDTTAGLAAAEAAAAGLRLRFVPGIEVSARFPGGSLHLLGLGIDPASRAIAALAAGLRNARDRRNPRMLARLRELGVEITLAELAELAGGGPAGPPPVIGRLHMARLLCRKGLARDLADAFDRYLGPGAPAYVDKERLAPGEAVKAIHAAGGLAVLAHPPQLNCTNLAQLDRVVRSLHHAGLDGIEVYHSKHTDEQTRALLDLAGRRGLLVSGGSDFHGQAAAEATLGRPRVPLAAVQQLLAKLPR